MTASLLRLSLVLGSLHTTLVGKPTPTVVEALQLYSTLQHSTALQLYSALQYTSSTIPLSTYTGGVDPSILTDKSRDPIHIS